MIVRIETEEWGIEPCQTKTSKDCCKGQARQA